jgi:hypothetical protein
MKTFKEFEDKEDLDEGLSQIVKYTQNAVRRFASAFRNLFTLDFGQKKRLKIVIPFPEAILEDNNEGPGFNSRKLSGPQIEYYSCYHFGRLLEENGFTQALFQLDGRKLKGGYDDYRKRGHEIQQWITKGNMKKQSSTQMRQGQIARERAGIATAETLLKEAIDAVSKLKTTRKSVHVTVKAMGNEGTGDTKADFQVIVERVSKSKVAKNIEMNISHKYGYGSGQVWGTQTSAPALAYLLITGNYKGAKDEDVSSAEKMQIVDKVFGDGVASRANIYMANNDAREGNLKDFPDFNPIDYKKTMDRYYKAMKKVVEDEKNKDHILKSMGLEKDVEHFYVDHDADTNRMVTRYSEASSTFKNLEKQLSKDIKIVATFKSGAMALPMKMMYDGKLIYETSIQHLTANASGTRMGGQGKNKFLMPNDKGGKNMNIKGFSGDDISLMGQTRKKSTNAYDMDSIDAKMVSKAVTGRQMGAEYTAKLKKEKEDRIQLNRDLANKHYETLHKRYVNNIDSVSFTKKHRQYPNATYMSVLSSEFPSSPEYKSIRADRDELFADLKRQYDAVSKKVEGDKYPQPIAKNANATNIFLGGGPVGNETASVELKNRMKDTFKLLSQGQVTTPSGKNTVKKVAGVPVKTPSALEPSISDGATIEKAKKTLTRIITTQKLDLSKKSDKEITDMVYALVNKSKGKMSDINVANAKDVLKIRGIPVKEEVLSFLDFMG